MDTTSEKPDSSALMRHLRTVNLMLFVTSATLLIAYSEPYVHQSLISRALIELENAEHLAATWDSRFLDKYIYERIQGSNKNFLPSDFLTRIDPASEEFIQPVHRFENNAFGIVIAGLPSRLFTLDDLDQVFGQSAEYDSFERSYGFALPDSVMLKPFTLATAVIQVYELDMRGGSPFAGEFPFGELLRVSDILDYGSIPIHEARIFLTEKLTSKGEDLEILGSKIRFSDISFFGSLAIIVLQFYLWIFMIELRKRLSVNDKALDFPWIGVLNGTLPQFAMIVSTCLAPSITVIILSGAGLLSPDLSGWGKFLAYNFDHHRLSILSSVLGILCSYVASQIYAVVQKASIT